MILEKKLYQPPWDSILLTINPKYYNQHNVHPLNKKLHKTKKKEDVTSSLINIHPS